MAFEPIYEVAVVGGLRKMCSGKVVAEAKLVAPHGEEINKILGTSATVDVACAEVFTGEARIKGRVYFKVIYLSGEGIKCLDYTAEFSDKIESDLICDIRPCVCAKVLDTDIVSASKGEVKLAAVVEIDLFGEKTERIKYLASGGDGVILGENKMLCTEVCSSFAGTTALTGEEEIAGTVIECLENRVCIEKSVASSEMVIVEGEVISDVIYGNEVGHICIKTPFTVEIEAKCTSGQKAYASARIEDVKASVVEGERNCVVINYDVAVYGFIYEDKEMSLVSDAFSVECELNKTAEKLPIAIDKDCICYEDEVSGNVTLAPEMPVVDNIVTPVGSSVLVSSAYASDKKVTIEGLIRSNVVYFSAETGSYGSVNVEVPFSLTKAMGVNEGDEVYVCAEVKCVTVKIRRGNEIELKIVLGLCVFAWENKELCFISELSEGETIPPKDCALSLHIGGKKETLWEVARALCITPDEVMAQNPELVFPLSGGERIICYRKLNS